MKEFARHTSPERWLEDLNFSMRLLDARHAIERAIYTQGTYRGYFNNLGYTVDSFSPPRSLTHLVKPFQPVSLDVTASRHPNGTVVFEKMLISPEDDTPLSIEQIDATYSLIRQNNIVVDSSETSTIEAILRSTLPHHVMAQATPEQILQFVTNNSAIGESVIEQSLSRGTVSFARTETVDDSTETLAVENYDKTHTSGSDIVIRLALNESLHRLTQQPDHTERSLELEVQKGATISHESWDIDELLSETSRSSVFSIDTATRQHMKKITDTIADLIPLPRMNEQDE